MKKKMCYMLICCFMSCFSLGCSSKADQIANDVVNDIVGNENENVAAVKNGISEAYPDTTYGEAFEKYFGSPKWEYFKGTKEGPDDDGDGKPDYTEENIDIVEFTGKCMYQEVEVEALIQFTLEQDTFIATYLSYNDVPQSQLMLAALLKSVFTNEESNVEKSNIEEVESVSEEDRYPNLKSFITCICSFSDPPDLEGEALDKYFKEQYDLWRNKEGFYEVYMGEDGEFYYNENYVYE